MKNPSSKKSTNSTNNRKPTMGISATFNALSNFATAGTATSSNSTNKTPMFDLNRIYNIKKKYMDLHHHINFYPLQIDTHIWLNNIYLLCVQNVLLYGQLHFYYRKSLFVFSCLWLGKQVFYRIYLQYFSSFRIWFAKDQMQKASTFCFGVDFFDIVGLYLISLFLSFLCLLFVTPFLPVLGVIVIPALLNFFFDKEEAYDLMQGIKSGLFQVFEAAYYVGIVSTTVDMVPYLIYDKWISFIIIATVFTQNLVTYVAKILLFTHAENHIRAEQFHGWAEYPLTRQELGNTDLERVPNWKLGEIYENGTIVLHKNKRWKAIGMTNVGEPGSWACQVFIFIYSNPRRVHVFLICLQQLIVGGQAYMCIFSPFWTYYMVMMMSSCHILLLLISLELPYFHYFDGLKHVG